MVVAATQAAVGYGNIICKKLQIKPLTSYKIIVNLIKGTTTKKGLKIAAKIDRSIYKKWKKVSEEDFKKINIREHEINSKWNYTISKI